LNADAFSRAQMILKLIDRERHRLVELHRVENAQMDVSHGVDTPRLELMLRYQTTARREFYRALAEYEARGPSSP
jgi:hypothetical protein